MEIKHFETFYKKGLYIAKQSCQNVNSSKQAIEYARKTFSKTDLNSFYNIGVLSKKITTNFKYKNGFNKIFN